MKKIAVSACLLGQNVRYDGKNKHIELTKYLDPKEYKLIPICPEVEMGMPIPRKPIEIHKTNKITLVQVDDHSIDFTQQMKMWFDDNKSRFSEFDGFILKSKSPSCGNGTTKNFTQADKFFLADGLFVTLLKKEFKGIKIFDEKYYEKK